MEDRAEMDLQDREAYLVKMDPKDDRAHQDQWVALGLLGLLDQMDHQVNWGIKGHLGLLGLKANEEREVTCSLMPLFVQ